MIELFELFLGILIVFILSVFLLQIVASSRKRNMQQYYEKIEFLDNTIQIKEVQLTELEQELSDRKLDKSVSLTQIEIKALDIYEQSGIRIPTDILEDLHAMRFKSEKEAQDFIENQRYFWKLENTKKPYRRS